MLGNSFDNHAPHGRWIVNTDALDPLTLDISCAINDEVRRISTTHNLVFDPLDQVSYVSQVLTLGPGDLIYTGTPSGVGAGRNPPLWLKAGDRVRTTIGGIGTIDNQVVAD